jgi:hypothetical protein
VGAIRHAPGLPLDRLTLVEPQGRACPERSDARLERLRPARVALARRAAVEVERAVPPGAPSPPPISEMLAPTLRPPSPLPRTVSLCSPAEVDVEAGVGDLAALEQHHAVDGGPQRVVGRAERISKRLASPRGARRRLLLLALAVVAWQSGPTSTASVFGSGVSRSALWARPASAPSRRRRAGRGANGELDMARQYMQPSRPMRVETVA